MSPVKHPVSGSTLTFSLEEEMRIVRGQLGAPAARAARTLVKDGALRATLVGLGAGGALKPHRADGPITVQVLEGEIVFEASGVPHGLAVGSLLALPTGVTHAVTSPGGGIFLLTIGIAGSTPAGSGEA